MQKLLSSTVVAFALLGLPAHAEMTPTPLSGDARLVTFDFDPDNTYLVLTKRRAVTHLEFPDGERIQTLAAGDTTNWEFNASKDRRHLFIKAKIVNSTTSMTVITDKRSYQFVIKATQEGSKWYQRVTWNVPSTLLMDLEADEARPFQGNRPDPVLATPEGHAVRPESLRFNYTIEGTAPFRPTGVFDDGKLTWVRMPAGIQELPVVFALDDGNEPMLVNYVVKGEYLLIQRVVERMLLKIGKTQVTVVRNSKPQSNSLFGFRRNEQQVNLYGN